MRLDERKFMILKAIIDDYIQTAVPVGSRTISRKAGVGFSPATIRNEMSDLEELGYLDQPHTSAGRIPSAKAYRLYVDELIKAQQLSPEDTLRIHEHMDTRTEQVEQVIRRAANTLSDMTQYTSLVVAPQLTSMCINSVHLVPVSSNSALMIVVTNAGLVKDSVIRVPEGIENDLLYHISQLLTVQLHGLTLMQIRQQFAKIFKDLKENRKLFASVLDALENRLAEDEPHDVVVGGSVNLLHYPEYSDVEKARNFLSVLESKEKLYPLLKKAGSMEFTIRIGPENDLPELSECSLITATYHMGEHNTGTMGIIGPTRMNYTRVISVLDFMGKALSDLLSTDR
ncbi:heat-inducible transcriptional repressor HrcA [Eubacteriales bacterium OttesenSCG-928-N13]|nr:heat-inducible transcriptional repressor HrcA [Eubacteriales bacterium OttesenSCG-928-N13]